MKAIGVSKYGPPSNLEAGDIPEPGPPGDRDLIVQYALSDQIASSNDHSLLTIAKSPSYVGKSDRLQDFYPRVPKPFHVIGPDGAGTVLAVGRGVKYFSPGDEIFYGCLPVRQGAATERHLVDERLAGQLPRSWDFVQAACLPVTAGTAYEALIERLEIKKNEQVALLVINGAGGVGSMALQIARHALNLPVVISTAGRAETTEWCKQMGATHVLNHHDDLVQQVKALKLTIPLKYIFIIHDTTRYLSIVSEIAAPLGKVCSVVQGKVDFYETQFLSKSLTFSWCWLGSKQYHGVDRESQHAMMTQIANWASEGTIKTHLTKRLKLTRAGLVEAHESIESGTTIGKIGLGIHEQGSGVAFG